VIGGGDVPGSLFLLGGMLCIIGASFSVCYAIWSRGWEGWESWNARTGLDEDQASYEREDRLLKQRNK